MTTKEKTAMVSGIQKMPVMEAAVKILESEGVEVIFGIPGAGILPFYQALQKSKIKHFLVRHEEGATHMADGYARATGKVGVCCCTSGPAGTNMVTGLYTAQVDSIPIIAITGQNVSGLLGKEAFQAVDIAEIVKPVTKKSYCVKDAALIPVVFREAFRIAKEGRPGPILIDLPLDAQKGTVSYEAKADSPLEITKPTPNPVAIEKAVDMLLQAQKPVIVAGGGIILSDACKEIASLAEYLSIPVITTVMGKSSFPNNHPLYAGIVGVFCDQPPGNKVFLDSDVVLGVGCRFGDRHTGDLAVYTRGRKFIHIDICPTQIGRIIPTDLGIVSDAKPALQAMLDVAKKKTRKIEPSERVKEIPVLRQTMARRLDFDNVPIKPQRVFKEINSFFDEDTIFVTTIGLNQIFSSQLQRVVKPRHYVVCGGAGPLGWDVPASIGVKIAKPENNVVAITGDFGFGFMCEELAVAAMYNIPIKVIILNDGHLGLIKQAEELNYGYNYAVDTWYDVTLAMPPLEVEAPLPVADCPDRAYTHFIDFVKFAESFGVQGTRVETPEEIRPAFRRALEAKGPYVVEIVIGFTNTSGGVNIEKIVERE
jgi:tartronate-semialdehyde synthase